MRTPPARLRGDAHRTEPGEGGAPPWGMLATYRCQDATNRLTVGFRLAEGAPAALQAYVVPAISPKACSIVYYRYGRCRHPPPRHAPRTRHCFSVVQGLTVLQRARCSTQPGPSTGSPDHTTQSLKPPPFHILCHAHTSCRLPPLCLHQRIALDVVGLAGEQRGGPGPGGGAGGAPFSELSLSGVCEARAAGCRAGRGAKARAQQQAGHSRLAHVGTLVLVFRRPWLGLTFAAYVVKTAYLAPRLTPSPLCRQLQPARGARVGSSLPARPASSPAHRRGRRRRRALQLPQRSGRQPAWLQSRGRGSAVCQVWRRVVLSFAWSLC